MSFKDWSAAQTASNKINPDNNAKPVPKAGQQATPPENEPAAAAPESKSKS